MNTKMYELGSHRSEIRELFEYGQSLLKTKGADYVFDFSIGNPNIPAPEKVNKKIIELLDNNSIHLYTSAQGSPDVRQKISTYLKSTFDADMPAELIYMTTGAAAALSIVFKALIDDNHNEFIVFAPYFPEYKVFVEANGGTLKVQPANDTLGLNLEGLKELITPKTIGIIINSPNNPSGNIYSEEEIKELADLLLEYKSKGQDIYLIADEPYRELAYDNMIVPYVPNYYDDVIVCYSWSKSLSLAGERIGYIAVSPKIKCCNELYLAVCGAGRALGYVCASSLFQNVCADCLGDTADLEIYKRNRDLLYNALTEYGFRCVYPKGAFYLFLKSPVDNENFLEKAKALGILFVPSESFGVDGWVRIAYCVSPETITKSLPYFKLLAEQTLK